MYKAELVKEGTVIKTFSQKTEMDFQDWKFLIAIQELDPKGQEIKWYINGERILS